MVKSIELRVRAKPLALAVASAFFSAGVSAQTASTALPTGGQVAAGTATLTYTPNKLQIDQSSNKAILNWDTFSIGSSAWVNFSQPSSSAVALNRVAGTNPSEIFGRLTSNGQVFLSNPNGVLFAPSASVDVGGLFATTLAIADKDFLAGRYNFYNAGGAGSVVNQGIITATGYASLAGPQVKNDGIIIARAGTVALAAGDRVSLDMIGDGLIKVSVDQAALNASAINSGRIEADGGNVILTARSANALLDTVVNNSGVIRANSLIERNGEIVLDGGSAGVVANTGTLQVAGIDAGTKGGTITVVGDKVGVAGVVDASGDVGGGSVTIGRGASVTAIEAGATIRADATREGQGGYVETSGAHLQVSSAPRVGAGGTWLIDPYNLIVTTSSSSNSGAPDFTPTGNDSQVDAALIVGQLNSGANVVLDTGSAGSPGSQAGDIRIQAPIEKTVANSASLRLKAFHDVDVSEPIFIASSAPGPAGFGTLAIEAGNAVVVNAPITTPGGGLSITAGSFTNRSAINNGVGGFNPGMAITADSFDLAGGTINGGLGSVGLFTRTPGRSMGIESPGDTTLTNGDIASITTSPDVPGVNSNQVFLGTNAGAITIGANTQVDAGSKNLLFSTFGGAANITVGSHGLRTTGDIGIDAGAGSLGGTGRIEANRAQLIAGTIGTGGMRLQTGVGTLAARATNGNVLIAEADDVNLAAVVMAGRTISNGVPGFGMYDLQANGTVTVSGVANVGGRFNVDAGALNLLASGSQDAVVNSVGGQSITAQSVSINARDGRRAALANNGSGDQTLTVGSGGVGVSVTGAGVAQIANNAPAGTQTIQTNDGGSILVSGGSAGTDSFATVSGATQWLAASGDVVLNGGSGAGTPVARIGGIGLPASPTQLNLSARDVVLNGGSSTGGQALIGSAVTSAQTNTVTVNAARDVVLHSDAGAAIIGTSANFATPAAGDIAVTGGNSIRFDGPAAGVRTAGNVTLNAPSVRETSSGFIVANTLDSTFSANVDLRGPNQVRRFTNFSGGDLKLVNDGALELGPLVAQDASVRTVGTGGDLIITNGVTTNGALELDASGTVAIRNALVRSWGGQTVNARAVEVSASNNGFAALWNSGAAEQKVTAANGAGVDVRASGGGLAQVMADGGSSQSIKVTNGDHIVVDGAGGSAVVIASNSPQTLSITGNGANAIRIGSAGAMGSSIAHGSLHQSVTAGNLGESGSITIVGPGLNGALAGLYTNPNAGGTQTISTSGTISITGGDASDQSRRNFFAASRITAVARRRSPRRVSRSAPGQRAAATRPPSIRSAAEYPPTAEINSSISPTAT